MPEIEKRKLSNEEIIPGNNKNRIDIHDSKANRLFDEALQNRLSNYSVEDVRSLLNSIIADKSVKRYQRDNLVAMVVVNQPHPTAEFSGYDLWNRGLRSLDRQMIVKIAFFFPLFLVSIVSVAAGGLLTMLIAVLITSIFSGAGAYKLYQNSPISHRGAFGDRAKLSLSEFKRSSEEGNQEKSSDAVESSRITVSLGQAKSDYNDAMSRIASYETNLDKALKYPAFNDIHVNEVSTMIKQLRRCNNLVKNVHEGNAEAFSKEVDELWVHIGLAEERAKRIGLKSMNAEELKLLEKIKGLAAHAGDPTYSDDVRTGFYQQLKISVNKLNENRTVVPTKIVTEIEQKAALLLGQQTKREGVSHV